MMSEKHTTIMAKDYVLTFNDLKMMEFYTIFASLE